MTEGSRYNGRTLGHRRHCPTCGAQRSADVCHRCRSDLTELIRVEQHADALRDWARACYGQGFYRRAAALADQAASLEATPDGLKLAACAHLLSGNFAAAWKALARTH